MHKLQIRQEEGDTLGSIGVKIHAALADANLLQAMQAFGEEMDRCTDGIDVEHKRRCAMFAVIEKYANILPSVEV